MTKIISFPHIGDYSYLIKPFFENVTGLKVMLPPPITKKTIDIGSRYSPDTVCMPFKYNLGNYIEALDMGANVLFQFGGGCRYGNYAEVQKTILSDLGYDFTFHEFIYKGKTSFNHVYKMFKSINPNLKRTTLLKEFILIFLKILIFDKSEHYTRSKIEKNDGDFKRLKYKFLNELKNERNVFKIFKIKYKYNLKRKAVKTKKARLKVGIIGELYTAMEPFSTYNLEDELKKFGISIKRFTNVSYLLIYKKIFNLYIRMKTKKYLKFYLGADSSDNVFRTLYLKKKGYDGIIHTKPFGCTPEVLVIPILEKISKDKDIPIMFLSFDNSQSDTGMKTRIEAFYDMLLMRKDKKYEKIKRLFRH